MKPTLNQELSQAKIVFKPWKKRISAVMIVIDLHRDLMEQFNEVVEDWRAEGQHKGRTIWQFIVIKHCRTKI